MTSTPLAVGDTIPDFSLPDQQGEKHSPSDARGSWLLLYFYPKDDTPGCTTEACGIRDAWEQFQAEGITVWGISADTPAKHQKFIEKHDLPFTLLSDEDKEVIQQLGVWQEKSMYGKKYMGIARMSYLIDPQGTIAHVYPKVKPADHAAEILKDKAAAEKKS